MRVRPNALWLSPIGLALGVASGYIQDSNVKSLTFLSVGQGDCAVFRASGATVLFDAGPSKEGYDAGLRLVAPKLRAMGVTRVDLVLLSHPDMDHIGGLAGLKRRLDVGSVAMLDHFRGHAQAEEVFEKCGIASREVVWLPKRAVIRVGSFKVLVEAPAYLEGMPDNDGSMFAKIEGEGASAVLTGDAGEEMEIIQAARGDWSAEVLKAGHHGSNTATCEAWLREVRPKFVVASCGRDNAYGHPAMAVVERATALGARFLRTDTDGDIAFEVRNGDFVRVK